MRLDVRRSFTALLVVATIVPSAALADPVPESPVPGGIVRTYSGGYTPTNPAGQVEVVLKDHVFSPAEIRIPPRRRIQLLIKNQDPTADEFGCSKLKIEKIIGGYTESVLNLRPMEPGHYPFVGDFNAASAKGVLIVE